ncbi:MAG: hypothetical protein K5907_05270, partial [Treponema sp.]|nr:hypothetical protein [Treponema sp.]
MDPQEFSFATGNISIKNGMDDLTYAFSTPKFDKENKILTITPRGNDLYNYVSSKNAPFITVTIALSDKISIKKVSGQTEYTIPLKQDENSTFTVKYNPRKELELPEKYDFFASTTEISLQNVQTFNDTDGVNSNTKYSNIDLSDFTNSQALSNSTTGSVYIYGRYYDKDSGVASVVLTVKKTNDRKGIKVSEQAQTITFLKDNNDSWQIPSFNGNAVITDNGSFTEFVIKYDIPHDTTKEFNNDGAFYFTVEVSDACLNKAETMETFTAIKDTFVDMTNVDVSNSSWSVSSDPLSDDDIYSKLKYIKIENANKNIYSNFNESLNNFTVSYTSNGIQKTGTMLGSGSSKWYTLEIDNNEISDLKITITATDKLGNQASKDFYFPPKPLSAKDGKLAVIQPSLQHVTAYRYRPQNNPTYYGCYLPYKESNTVNFLYSYTGANDRVFYQNGNLLGDFITLSPNLYTKYSHASQTVPDVKLEYTKIEGNFIYYDISVESEGYQNDFDDIFVLLYVADTTNTTALHCIGKGSRKISACSNFSSRFYNSPVYLTAWATKDNYYYTKLTNQSDPIYFYSKDPTSYTTNSQAQKKYPPIKNTEAGQGQLSNAQPDIQYLTYENVKINNLKYPLAFDYFCCSRDGNNNPTSTAQTMIININDIEYIYDNSVFSFTENNDTKLNYYIPVW